LDRAAARAALWERDEANYWRGRSDERDYLTAQGQYDRKLVQADLFLREQLRDGCEVPATTMLRRAREAGIAERTLRRAKATAGVASVRRGNRLYWRFNAAKAAKSQRPVPKAA
jgi:hypothetical protein